MRSVKSQMVKEVKIMQDSGQLNPEYLQVSTQEIYLLEFRRKPDLQQALKRQSQ